MIYTHEYRINASETDINSIAPVSAIFRYLQDCANYHLAAMGTPYEEMFANGQSFVLSKITLKMNDTLSVHDKFSVSTWAYPSRAYSFIRNYRIHKNGVMIGEASSIWALLDTRTKSLIKVESTGYNEYAESEETGGINLRERPAPDLDYTKIYEKEVMYSDMDLNGHMNNTRYPDVYCNGIETMKNRYVSEIAIHYRKEAPGGVKLDVLMSRTGDRYNFRTVNPDGEINSEAKIILENIGEDHI